MRPIAAMLLMASLALLVASCAPSVDEARERAFFITDEAYNKFWGKDWNRVIDLCTRAIEEDPEFPWPYSVRGAAYNAIGRFDMALADLNMAIRLSPDFTPAYTNRGLTHLRLRDYENARADLLEAIKLDPGDVIAMVTLAEVYSMMEADEQVCDTMKDAVGEGFTALEDMAQNPAFKNFMATPCYKELRLRVDEIKLQIKEAEEAVDQEEVDNQK